jgi:hypothetical protein
MVISKYDKLIILFNVYLIRTRECMSVYDVIELSRFTQTTSKNLIDNDKYLLYYVTRKNKSICQTAGRYHTGRYYLPIYRKLSQWMRYLPTYIYIVL